MHNYRTVDQIEFYFRNKLEFVNGENGAFPRLLYLLSLLKAAGGLSGHDEDRYLAKYFPSSLKYPLDLESIHRNVTERLSLNTPHVLLNRYAITSNPEAHLTVVENEVSVPYRLINVEKMGEEALEAFDRYFARLKNSVIKQYSVLSNFHRYPPYDMSLEVFE